MRQKPRYSLFWLLTGFVLVAFSAPMMVKLLVGCSGSDKNYLDDEEGITAVNSAAKASSVVREIRAAVEQALLKAGSGPFNATTVDGIAGTATITGQINSVSLSSSQCSGNRKDVALSSVTFDGYEVKSSNADITLTGKLSYSDKTSHQSCPTSSYANCISQMESLASVKAKIVFTGVARTHGYDDTVTFSVDRSDSKSTNCSDYTGHLSASSGSTFTF